MHLQKIFAVVRRSTRCQFRQAAAGLSAPQPSKLIERVDFTKYITPVAASPAKNSNFQVPNCDTNSLVIVGVANNIITGQKMQRETTEFRLLMTNRAISADGSQLAEKQAFRVVLFDSFAIFGRTIKEGEILHVVGRLHFQPRFNAAALDYDYAHEVLVTEQVGSVTRIVRY